MYSNLPRGIIATSKDTVARAFSLEYRLASNLPFAIANPFPAFLLDAISGYYYLVHTLGFAPSNIIVVGDSAGGNLAIALVRYLTLAQLPAVPAPGALVLPSPNTDRANTHAGTPQSTAANAASDIVGVMGVNTYNAVAYRGRIPADELRTSPWMSPASLALPHPDGVLAGFPPTCVVTGGTERGLDSMRTLRDRLEHDNGKEKVLYLEYPEAFHDFIPIPWMEPERTQALQKIDEWLKGIYA